MQSLVLGPLGGEGKYPAGATPGSMSGLAVGMSAIQACVLAMSPQALMMLAPVRDCGCSKALTNEAKLDILKMQ